MDRATALITIKQADDEQRYLAGIASHPSPDRELDVIDAEGVYTTTPDIPLLLYHDSTKIVGRAKLGKATAAGVPFQAWMPKNLEPGVLRDRVEEAWALVKHRLLTGVSVGFRPVLDKIEQLRSGGRRYRAAEILELSIVPVPAQSLATIDVVRSLANQYPQLRSNTMPTGARGQLTLNADLEFELAIGGTSHKFKMDPTTAHRLADEIQSFALRRKSTTDARRTSVTVFGADRKAGVVYLDKPLKKEGVVYLGKPKGLPVVRLNRPTGIRALPVVRLGKK